MGSGDFLHETKTLKGVYVEIKNILAQADVVCADLEARRIIEERTPYDTSSLITSAEAVVSDDEYKQVMCDVEDRLAGKPLSRIYQSQEFWGLPFKLSRGTLDPRSDSELIVELAVQHFAEKSKPVRILDLGTGSGCLLIALLSEFEDAIGYGIDLCFDAVLTAKENARKNHVHERAGFICGSWIDSVDASDARFDLIVSNPPYISNQIIPNLMPEVVNYDPILALDGGGDGLEAYKKLFPIIKSVLKPDGIALFEIGYDQGEDVMRLAEDTGFALRSVHVDYSGNPRVVEISCGDK